MVNMKFKDKKNEQFSNDNNCENKKESIDLLNSDLKNNKNNNSKELQEKLELLEKENKENIKKINSFNEIQNNLNKRIKDLETQNFNLNNNFKNEVIKKTDEAQKLLNEKIKEFNAKNELEIKSIKKYAIKDNIVKLLNIISDFENVLNHKPNNELIANYLKGFEMFLSMFKNYLNEIGIKEIEIHINDDFDPSKMSPLDIEENKDFKSNKVVKILKKGYMLHDQIVLPATVIVSK